MSIFSRHKTTLPSAEEALPGRADQRVRHRRRSTGSSTRPSSRRRPPRATRSRSSASAASGAPRRSTGRCPGVWSTSVGYAGGTTPNPSYEEVCSGRTGHTEAVRIVFDPSVVSYADLVKTFFEVHDPTQGMRQGNDVGTQYRSAIYYTTPEQEQIARELTKVYGDELHRQRLGDITTEIRPAGETPYYYAEDHHQQYLAKNPFGYRCHANTGSEVPRDRLTGTDGLHVDDVGAIVI